MERKPPSEKKSGFKAWQLRAARAAADISIQALADRSGVSVSSIRRAEDYGSQPMSRVNQKALLDALAASGVTMSAPGMTPATVMMADTAPEADAPTPTKAPTPSAKAKSATPEPVRTPKT